MAGFHVESEKIPKRDPRSDRGRVSELIELTKDTDDGSGKRTEKAGTLGENIDSLSLSSYTGTKGLGAFCSMANKPMQHFLKQLGYCANFNYTSIEHRNVNLLADSLMGISYVVSDESEIPGLTAVSSSGKYTLFENPYSVGMVFLAEKDAYGFDGYSLEKIAGETKDEEDLKDKKAEPEKVIEKDYFAFQEDLLSSLTGIGADKVFDARHLTWEVFNAQKSEGRFIKEPLEYDLKKDRLNLENIEEGYTAPTYYLRGSNKSPIILKATMYVKTDGPVYLSVPFLMKSAPVSIYCNGKCIYKEESTSYYSVIVDAGIHGQGELITFEIRNHIASVKPLYDGRVLISVRQSGARGYNHSSDGGKTWGTQGRWECMKTNACNGDMLRIAATDRGDSRNILLHSVPNSMERRDVSIFVSYDEGETWQDPVLLFDGPSVYSSMTLLKNGSVGVFLEENPNGACELWYQNWPTDSLLRQ